MDTELKVTEMLAKEEDKLKNDSNYQDSRDFILEMQEEGILRKPSYTFPPLDTIGKGLYENHQAHKKGNEYFE